MISQTKQTAYRLSNLDAQQQKITYQMSTKKKNFKMGVMTLYYTPRVISVDDKIRTYEGLQSQSWKTTVQNNTSDSSLKDIKKTFRICKTKS